jgi:predicted lipoprotein with Yx(FWY)xxD motif
MPRCSRHWLVGLAGLLLVGLLDASAMAAPRHAVISSRQIDDPVSRVLANDNGRVMYLFTRDSAGTSRCDATCQTRWVPVTSLAAPRAGGSVRASHLGVTADHQVTYFGHPLYYSTRDTKPEQHRAEGTMSQGGKWYLISTSGSAVRPVDCNAPGSLCVG